MNNRFITLIVAAFLLIWSASTLAALDALEEGYELHISELVLPAHAAGQVVINGCSTCESVTHPVNSSTNYYIDNSLTPLADFRDAVAAEVGTFIYVAYSLDTGYVTHITLSTSTE